VRSGARPTPPIWWHHAWNGASDGADRVYFLALPQIKPLSCWLDWTPVEACVQGLDVPCGMNWPAHFHNEDKTFPMEPCQSPSPNPALAYFYQSRVAAHRRRRGKLCSNPLVSSVKVSSILVLWLVLLQRREYKVEGLRRGARKCRESKSHQAGQILRTRGLQRLAKATGRFSLWAKKRLP
jgi:hypothetical protein